MLTKPRPLARSCDVPPELAAKLAPEIARAQGADANAAEALGAALARTGKNAYRVTLVVHRMDDEPLRDADLKALRGMHPDAPVQATPQTKTTVKRAAARTARAPAMRQR